MPWLSILRAEGGSKSNQLAPRLGAALRPLQLGKDQYFEKCPKKALAILQNILKPLRSLTLYLE
jgi:hypothetical protein